MGVRDFDVVAEDPVETDLERRDAGLLDQSLLITSEELCAVFCEVAEIVELGVVAAPDQAAFLDRRWGLVDNGRCDSVDEVG